MITTLEHDLLQTALADYLAGYPADPRGPLVAALAGGSIRENLKICATPAAYAAEALRVCVEAGWACEPTDLERLIDLVAHLSADVDTLKRELHTRRPTQQTDPYDELWLPCEKVVLDRGPVRKQLRLLAAREQLDKPILVVEGPKHMGKSHTEWLARHICERNPDLLAAVAGLSEGQESATGPLELAMDLAFEIASVVEDPDIDTVSKRFSIELARWVVKLAMDQPKRVWIIIEGFQGEKLRADTRTLISDLADQFKTHRIKEKGTRLILLGFERAHLRVQSGSMHIDTVCLPLLSDLETYFTVIAARAAKPFDPVRVAGEIWAGLPQGDTWLPTLHELTRVATKEILREQP